MNEDEKKIVISRLETMPSGLLVSIGNFGTFNKIQMIDNINKETKVGELIVKVYMTNIRSFKE